MTIPEAELEYAPVTGLGELREKVADYYNHLYRQGKESQYTKENVCVIPGGRAGLTRIMAVLGIPRLDTSHLITRPTSNALVCS